MTDPAKDNTPGNTRPASPWYRSAVATTVVAAAFSVIILAVLVANYVRGRVYETRWEKKLETLKVELTANPDREETLIADIRRLDLEFRRHKLRRLDHARVGGYLLLGSVVVFLVGIKCVDSFKKKLPSPQAVRDQGGEQVRQARLARWSVAAALGTVAVVLLLFTIGPDIDLATSDVAGYVH